MQHTNRIRQAPLGLLAKRMTPRPTDKNVELLHARALKCPNANREWRREFVFPQERRGRNPQTGEQGRLQIDESLVQKLVTVAVRQAGRANPNTSHTYRHSFATHLVADGYEIGMALELLAHYYVRTTMICPHVFNPGERCIRRVADVLTRRPDE